MAMDTGSESIDVGYRVEVILMDRQGKPEHLAVTIVADDAADFAQGYLGQSTPLAQALIGEKVGTTIPYLKDDIYSIEIISVNKAETDAPKNIARRRQAAVKKAIREVEDTNARLFASSFSGKWGDYDPDSILKDKKPEDTE
jgi:hypothetical protein